MFGLTDGDIAPSRVDREDVHLVNQLIGLLRQINNRKQDDEDAKDFAKATLWTNIAITDSTYRYYGIVHPCVEG